MRIHEHKRDRTLFVALSVGAVIICGLVVSANAVHFPIALQHEVATSTVPFVTLVQGRQTAIQTRTNYRIASEAQLSQLWTLLAASGTPPYVDFTRTNVLAVFAGSASSSAVQVSRVTDGTARDVLVTIVLPEGSCADSTNTGVPFELIAVAASALPLTHTDYVAPGACDTK